MTIEWNCDCGDYSSGSHLVNQFNVTTNKGVSLDLLKAAELSEFRGLWEDHVWDHPGHSATYSFSIPEGYEVRDGVIYKSENQAAPTS